MPVGTGNSRRGDRVPLFSRFAWHTNTNAHSVRGDAATSGFLGRFVCSKQVAIVSTQGSTRYTQSPASGSSFSCAACGIRPLMLSFACWCFSPYREGLTRENVCPFSSKRLSRALSLVLAACACICEGFAFPFPALRLLCARLCCCCCCRSLSHSLSRAFAFSCASIVSRTARIRSFHP